MINNLILLNLHVRIISKLTNFNHGKQEESCKKEIVDCVLTAQLNKMDADGVIDKDEALMKTDLQGLFCLSYDQFLEVVNKVVKEALDKGANIKDLDTFLK